ncbi:unnamed protein product [Pleuronectes platessa]|uniref:Uncharacterized protein n=1 Tax=Pleuronectes platessa TaxID=8262 RepID=A0A9N7UCB2_PLEPL|nr:unnamed protein product [Pleuronectes platessa]
MLISSASLIPSARVSDPSSSGAPASHAGRQPDWFQPAQNNHITPGAASVITSPESQASDWDPLEDRFGPISLSSVPVALHRASAQDPLRHHSYIQGCEPLQQAQVPECEAAETRGEILHSSVISEEEPGMTSSSISSSFPRTNFPDLPEMCRLPLPGNTPILLKLQMVDEQSAL